MTARSSSQSQPQYIPSEAYRAMLVRDGERRFQEWHTTFLNYQKAYLQAMDAKRKR
jgi:hypothetical protein